MSRKNLVVRRKNVYLRQDSNTQKNTTMEKMRKNQSLRHFCLLCLLLLPMLLVSGACGAQTVRNGNYSTVGHIDSDGTVRDGNYSRLGKIDSDGTVRNANYSTIGHIEKDGTVRDGNYRTIGHIEKDGTVRDGSYRTIGHVERDGTVRDSNYRTIGHMKDVPSTYAAALFFFFGLL